jgi:hypothetical protein
MRAAGDEPRDVAAIDLAGPQDRVALDDLMEEMQAHCRASYPGRDG